MWTVRLPKRVERELDMAPTEVQELIQRALHELQRSPFLPGCKKLKGRLQCWRLRVGAYQILYDVLSKEHVILITKIGPRKDVYR